MSKKNTLIDKEVILDCGKDGLSSLIMIKLKISESNAICSLLFSSRDSLKKDDLIGVWGRKGVVVFSSASYYKLNPTSYAVRLKNPRPSQFCGINASKVSRNPLGIHRIIA